MATHLDLLGFLAMGLLGGAGHCVGMCAPFVLWVSRGLAPEQAPLGPVLGRQLAYATGRLITYSLLGALAGLLGSGVDLATRAAGLQHGASLLAGVGLVLYATGALLGVKISPAPFGRLFSRLAGKRPPQSALLVGLLLGLLPCGLVYSALLAAAAQGGPARGGLALALFGLGTWPAMLVLVGADRLLVRERRWLDRAALALVGAMGLLFASRGLVGLLAE